MKNGKFPSSLFLGSAMLVILIGGQSRSDGSIVYSGLQDYVLGHSSDEAVPIFMAAASEPFYIVDIRGGFDLQGVSPASYSTVFDLESPGSPVVSVTSGNIVDGSLDWNSISSFSRILRYDDPGFGSGDFFDRTDAYMPVRIGDDDDTYYGWLRMSHSMAGEQLTVHDWAWNSAAGEPILVGEIPEPRAFALLAGLAVLGWILWRRR